MFTIEQIKIAHSKVKSGADFPAYIRDLRNLGVSYYETFVKDGHSDYFGSHDYKVSSELNTFTLKIAKSSNVEQFKADLQSHQQGNTDYFTFCIDCSKSGIEKWVVSIIKMRCTYYDSNDNEILTEEIIISS